LPWLLLLHLIYSIIFLIKIICGVNHSFQIWRACIPKLGALFFWLFHNQLFLLFHRVQIMTAHLPATSLSS
jgi:hypothetical protein